MTLKHRRRLRRLGWERALEPPDDGLWAAGDPPPREGCSLEVLVDGAQALPAIAEAMQNARDFVHITGWHLAPALRARPRRAAGHHRRAAGRAGRAHRRARARVGRRAGAGLPPDALGGQGGRPHAHAQHAHPLRDRSARAPVPLPPREDDHHRRGAGLRQRHRPHRRRRRPLRLERAPRPAAPGLARRRHPPARPRGGRRPRSLRGPLVRGDRRAPRAPRPAGARGRQHRAGRAHGGREHVRRLPEGRLPDPRELHARAAQRAAPDLPREPVPVVAGDRRRSWPTSCATRRATTSASSSCCPPRPTTARTRLAASSASSPRPTTTPGASWRPRSARAPASARIRSTSTPRSASSTTAG